MWDAIGAVRDLGRLHDIASVLIRYGFGDLVRRVGMAGALEKAGRALHWRAPEELARLAPPARVRRALEELGPSFVKLGQILATRVDLFAPEWIDELSKLQDEAPPLPFEALRAQLTDDLGAPPEEIFPVLDTTALAAASLAQVHRAQLPDGTEVVLKVRRPGIRPVVEADLRLLERVAEIIDKDAPDLRRYRPREVVRQFVLSLRRELDFAAEARNAERVAANLAERADIVVPRIHWRWTCERLNVQDFVDGIAGRDLRRLPLAGLSAPVLARRGATAVLQMILDDGFFHADPHPGNVFYLPDNRIAFIDFGMVGRLSETRRYEVAQVLSGLVSHDSEGVADILLDWSSETRADTDALRDEIDAFVDQYRGVPLQRLDMTAMLADVVAILRDHGLALPPDLALLIKAFVTLEGLGRQLDPDFDMASEAAPYLRQAMLAHNAPTAVARRGWRALASAATLLASLPRDIRTLLRAAQRGRLQVQVDVPPLDRFGERMDKASNRLALAILTAALIVGSSIVISVEKEPLLAGFPPLGVSGFIAALIGALAVLISILRSHKR
ncbi:ubiquinone biosynthesis protein UbiB [Nitrogeniibacter mangrovi]|uniref:Ubiquinone biosynthesis protein UbiB n=1 Tax=Nitrogeniibacter mangrovi TaxID=2016596 RepID=A0A6C1B8D5_9RHOO|nr:ubiquinone biosynthesis protein UbiB [Nitrogeniibacter mangrovi]